MSGESTIQVSSYTDLNDGISGASNGDIIQLNASFATSGVINIENKILTLDLNGQTLTLSGLNRIEVGAGGDLTITDSSTTSAGKIVYTVVSNEHSAIKVAGNSTAIAKLTLDKCEIVVNENNNVNGYGVYAASYSEVTSGDEVTITAGYSAISGNGLNSGAIITITGGSYTSNNSAAIYFPSTNKLTVTGGTFTGATGFDIRAGTVDISGAEITANGSYTNVADDSDSTRTDIPTVWGMGIAIIDHVSYSKDVEISITLSNLAFTGDSVCDLYIGDFNQSAGKFNEDNLDQTFTVNKSITVTVTDVLNYSVTNANATSGYLIVDDLDTSSKTFTVTNLFNKGDATVENKGTIVVNDLIGLTNAAAIGGNIQLDADIEIEGLTTFLTLADKTVLDLNDKTITMNTTCVESNGKSSSINRLLVNNGNVTIKNGSIVDTATSTDRSPIIVSAGSGLGGSGTPKLIIDDVTITSKNEYGIVVFTGELEVKNNSSITAKLSAISGNGTMEGSNITLNGGTYTSTTTAAIFFPSTTKLTIENSAEIIGKTGIDIRAGTLDIKNSSITASGNTSEEFPASNGPSGWGIGIAVFDHSSYASGTTIDVKISNVTFDCTTCNIFVGKHPGDGKSGNVSFSNIKMNTPNHKINVTINDVDFETKGLYIKGANDVTITGCTFTNIIESAVADDTTQVNAIYLESCTGNVIIGGETKDDYGNTIENVSSSSSDLNPQYGRGIFISYSGASEKSLTIRNNSISNISFNALQLSNLMFSKIIISHNIIENWDADDDGALDDYAFAKGRAMRLNIDTEFNESVELSISHNEFIKTYNAIKEYDIYNIIYAQTNNTNQVITLENNKATITYESVSKLSNGLMIDSSGKSYVRFPSNTESGISLDITINEVNFTEKGLFISGANEVTITDCTFTDISSGFETTDLMGITPHMYHPTAIHVQNSSGKVLIEDNTINGVGGGKEVNKKFMGISITNLKNNTNTSSIEIKDNDIFNIDHNAVYIFGTYSTISITDGNKFSEWDKNNDSVDAVQDINLAGGRAVRIDATSNSVNISNNIFVKNYLKTLDQDAVIFGSDLGGSTNNIGYDDGNILKISNSTNISFADNILNLTGIEMNNYLDKNLFNFADENTRYIILFNANDGSFGGEGNILCSITTDSISEPTSPSRSSYSFKGWYSDSNLTTPFTDFTTPISEDTTLYAKWTYTGGSGTPVTPPTDDPEPKPIIPDENNNVTVPSIDDKKADELIHEAVSSGSDSVSIIGTSDVKGEYTEVTVSKSDLETISKKIENNNNINSVSIETSEGDIIIEKEVLNSILETTDSDSISFEIEDAKDKLTEEQKEAVGDRPVYDINIKAGNENITSFNGKTITISLPYTLKAGEDPENIVVYYVKEDGSLEKVNCTYKDGKVIFETDHLSKYVIGYEESDKPVTPDTPDNKKDDNNTIYYAVAAVIVILIIIALAYYFMKKKQ